MNQQGKFAEVISGQRALAKMHAMQAGVDAREVKRFSTGIRLAAAVVTTAIMVNPAMAQSLKTSMTSGFLYAYSLVGILGALAVLVSGVNWATGNWLGREDPKKTFMAAIMGTGIAFGCVAFTQWVKDTVGANQQDISNL